MTSRHLWSIGGLQQVIHGFVHRPGFAIGNKIGLAGTGRTDIQMTQGLKMGMHDIVDVSGIHLVETTGDEFQSSGFGALDQTWKQLGIARAPNQSWAQRHGRQRGRIGGENILFGDGFGRRIRRLEILAIGRIASLPPSTGVRPAWVTLGVEVYTSFLMPMLRQAANTISVPTTLASIITFVTAPGTGFRGIVENRILILPA